MSRTKRKPASYRRIQGHEIPARTPIGGLAVCGVALAPHLEPAARVRLRLAGSDGGLWTAGSRPLGPRAPWAELASLLRAVRREARRRPSGRAARTLASPRLRLVVELLDGTGDLLTAASWRRDAVSIPRALRGPHV